MLQSKLVPGCRRQAAMPWWRRCRGGADPASQGGAREQVGLAVQPRKDAAAKGVGRRQGAKGLPAVPIEKPPEERTGRGAGNSVMWKLLQDPTINSHLFQFAQNFKRFIPLLAAPAAPLLSQEQAKAGLTYFIFSNAVNVEVQAVGSLILPNSSSTNSCGVDPGGLINSQAAVICAGPDGDYDLYKAQGPTSFNGTVTIDPADNVSGIPTILDAGQFARQFGIDIGYISGTSITSTAAFNNKTLAGLGFTTTGLLGTWILQPLNGADPYTANDTIQVVIGAPPSPSAAAPGPLPLLGAGAAFGWSRRLRKRITSL